MNSRVGIVLSGGASCPPGITLQASVCCELLPLVGGVLQCRKPAMSAPLVPAVGRALFFNLQLFCEGRWRCSEV